jgi:hypothetical protein
MECNWGNDISYDFEYSLFKQSTGSKSKVSWEEVHWYNTVRAVQQVMSLSLEASTDGYEIQPVEYRTPA